MSQVTVYEHNDYGGASQGFSSGEYFADRGQLSGIGNDRLSSLKVPLGLSVMLRENETSGTEEYYEPGDHP